MKIAVLGSGNGGCAVAFDWAQSGHEVYLFDFEEFPTNIDAISNNNGIYAEGQLEGFAEIKYAGHDLEKVVKDAKVIFVVGPAYSTGVFGKAIKPYLEKGQIIVVCPSSCGGSIVFKNAIDLDLHDDDIIIAETSTLPYAVRTLESGKIKVFLKLKAGVYIAALPSKHTSKVYDLLKDVYPALTPAKNVLQTTLQNGNPIIHPPITLLNAGLVERTGGNFYFYEEGVTTAVGRLIESLDKERMAIGKKLGLDIVPDPVIGSRQGYMKEITYDSGYISAPGFKGIKAGSTLDYRFFNEDVGYGLVFLTDLAKQVGVETPSMNSVIQIVSVLMGRDFKREGKRTMKTLNLDKYDLPELLEIL